MADGDNGNDKNMVPESQLIAAKKAAERKLEKAQADLQGRIDTLESELDSEKKSRLTAESSHSKTEKELTKAKASLEELDGIKGERDQATKSRDELSKSVIDLTRTNILESYELTEEVQTKLKGMDTLEALEAYAGVLTDVGKPREPGQRYDDGSGGGVVDTTGKSGRDLIKEGIAAQG